MLTTLPPAISIPQSLTPGAATGILTPAVAAVGALPFEGNLIPQVWYRHPLLRHDSNKANLVAITILAEIIYWYRPAVVRDAAGAIVGAKRKFAADKLRVSYSALAEKFGLTKRQVQDAVAFLKERGIITVELRDARSRDGLVFRNLVFVEPVSETLRQLSDFDLPDAATLSGRPDRNGSSPPRLDAPTCPGVPGHDSCSSGIPAPQKRDNTESLSEISGEISPEKTTAVRAGSKGGYQASAGMSAAGRGNYPTVLAEEETETLAGRLMEAGVNRADACRLARTHPEECGRQLEYLSDAPPFKTSRGAYLRTAIEQGFSAPAAWTAKRAEERRAERAAAGRETREAAQASLQREKERLEALQEEFRSNRPDAWRQIVDAAHALLPPPVRARPDGPGYKAALSGRIRQIIRDNQTLAILPRS